MVFLYEDDVSGEIFCYCETLEDPVQFPPPVVFGLTILGLAVMTVDIWPAGVGTVGPRVPGQWTVSNHHIGYIVYGKRLLQLQGVSKKTGISVQGSF